ncbi:MAG: DUF4935 domain-containing protein [Chitinophagales bacterium]|nr:DUF4935 domain-containing protein [Chitinophagales bacterium]
MKNIYIDTNVYLTFYHFSNEDLAELKKLIALINTDNICLYIPEQTKNEFYRNREVKIADSLDKLTSSKFNNQFPMICHNYDEYKEMKNAIKDYEKNKNSLLKKLKHDAETKTLQADEILNQLFDKAEVIKTTAKILNKAIIRYDIGNPPGKDKSYGDAINWESLLSKIPDEEDLYFISDDKDFYSKLNDQKFNDYLLSEWEEKKQSNLHYFRKITDFFKKHYPEIEITSETEKEIIIKNLYEAYSFDNAKSVVRKLRNFDNFSIKQLNDITTAFATNNQIYWIKSNWTILSARREIIEANKGKIDENIYKKYEYQYDL